LTAAAPSPGPALVADALVRRYGKNEAVRGISFEIARGELFGLVGPDGAGKTTTLRMLSGLVRPTSGTVRVVGVDPFGKGSGKVRDVLGLVPQEHSLYGDLSIEENLDFFRSLYGLSAKDYRSRRERLLEITRLGAFLSRRASQLSGGMYKKLALSCALLHQPEVLLLDEPTNGVDPVSRRELWELIYEFVEQGMCVVVSTPYMDEAARCHRVALVNAGRVLREGEPAALVRNFAGTTAEIEGGDREALHTLVATLPEIVAASPAGAKLRVVIAPGGQPKVEAEVAALGARLVPSPPDFEDLFLFEIAAATHEAARAA
jgi:ABC-2 type transport system ATP-binding protein